MNSAERSYNIQKRLIAHAQYIINFLEKGSVIFYQGGSWKLGGSGTLSKIKRGIKRFFQIKKVGSLISVKKIKYFVKHSWNSLLLILQKRWFCPLLELFQTRLRAAIWGESGFHTTKEHDWQPLQTFARSKKTYSKWTFGEVPGGFEPGTQLPNRWKIFGIYAVTYWCIL